MPLSAHAIKNRKYWTDHSHEWVERGRDAWESPTGFWGVFEMPQSEVAFFEQPSFYQDKDVVELGCGTGYVSAWLARMGARPVAVDVTRAQLESARRFQIEFGIDFALIEASAEALPFPDESFDIAVTEYGACIWCDPNAWIAEAARVLRPGGSLTFLRNSTLSMLCSDNTAQISDRLQATQAAVGKYEDKDSVEFHPPHSALIGILLKWGFEIVDLIEILVPEGSTSAFDYVSGAGEWASKWPIEEVWKARKRQSN